MNILVIGNGFDLAHGLPTKYEDFLEFIKIIKQCFKQDNFKSKEIDWGKWEVEDSKEQPNGSKIKDLLVTNKGKARDKLFSEKQKWKNLIDDNIWIEYFLQNNMHGKENWIDFESEISDIIQSLEYDMHGGENNFGLYDELIGTLSNEYLDCHKQLSELEIFKELRDRLYTDLNKLICALELYLIEYVNQIECKIISPDIKNIIVKNIEHEDGAESAIGSKIICFNYTDTVERVYKYCNSENIDYIHGKAANKNTVETNNMVLGIDEYLGKKKRNKQVEFIAFKKFYQRIHKGTGCKYKEWIDTIKGEYEYYQTELDKSRTEKNIMNLKATVNKLKKQYLNKHHVYIFGHSLDVTDKDILRDLILNDNVHTTIFYHDRDAMGQQIANLVKVIGQEELIRRTGGKEKLIEFKPQKPMIERNKE